MAHFGRGAWRLSAARSKFTVVGMTSRLPVTLLEHHAAAVRPIPLCLPSTCHARLYSVNPAPSQEDKEREIFKKIHLASKPESKVEKTVKTLIAKKMEEQDNLNYSLLGSFKDPPVVKPWYVQAASKAVQLSKDIWTVTFWKELWVSIKHELVHYKMGFKLMWVDVTVSTRLLGRVVKGHALTRREREQFVRTASDLMRLVPLIVVIVVPFLEFALPFALKLFPNMLPSTFQDKDAKSIAELKVKIEMAKFLQDTVEEMAVEARAKRPGASEGVSELAEFFEQSRRRGHVHTDEILKFAKLFDDELTLDNLQHPTLRALCRLLNLPALGTSNMLRFRLRVKLRELKSDDMVIMKEGVDSLSVSELQQACRERGMRALGISSEGLRQRLQDWITLHLRDNVPPSLLLMSRLLFVPEDIPEIEKLRIAINSLPDAVKDEVRVELEEVEGGDVDFHSRMKIILNEEQLIKQEQLEDHAAIISDAPKPSATASAAKSAAAEHLVDPAAALKVEDAQETPISTEELVELAFAILSMSDLEREEQLAMATLKEDMAEHKQDVSKLQAEAGKDLVVSDVSQRLATRVETMVARLEKKLVERNKQMTFRRLDLNRDGLISTDELMRVMKKLRNAPSEATMQVIASTLDTDADGLLALDVIKKVLAVVATEGADLKPRDLRMLAKLIEKEKALGPAKSAA